MHSRNIGIGQDSKRPVLYLNPDDALDGGVVSRNNRKLHTFGIVIHVIQISYQFIVCLYIFYNPMPLPNK